MFAKEAFERLANTPFHTYTEEDIQVVGYKDLFTLAKLKESVQEYYKILATEPPAVQEHQPDCTNHARCDKDWRVVWWNGVGRLLLDGRHQISWEDILIRFEGMQFGHMSEDCRMEMLKFLRVEDGGRHANNLVQEVAEKLASRFEENDGSL